MKKKRDPLYSNPVAQSVVRSKARNALNRLKLDSELQAWAGTKAAEFVSDACMLLFAVAYAHRICRQFPENRAHGRLEPWTPEARIMRGMASALQELAHHHDQLELHRPAIQSGLAAIERVIPDLEMLAVGVGFAECQERIAGTGIGAEDIHQLLKDGP